VRQHRSIAITITIRSSSTAAAATATVPKYCCFRIELIQLPLQVVDVLFDGIEVPLDGPPAFVGVGNDLVERDGERRVGLRVQTKSQHRHPRHQQEEDRIFRPEALPHPGCLGDHRVVACDCDCGYGCGCAGACGCWWCIALSDNVENYSASYGVVSISDHIIGGQCGFRDAFRDIAQCIVIVYIVAVTIYSAVVYNVVVVVVPVPLQYRYRQPGFV